MKYKIHIGQLADMVSWFNNGGVAAFSNGEFFGPAKDKKGNSPPAKMNPIIITDPSVFEVIIPKTIESFRVDLPADIDDTPVEIREKIMARVREVSAGMPGVNCWFALVPTAEDNVLILAEEKVLPFLEVASQFDLVVNSVPKESLN